MNRTPPALRASLAFGLLLAAVAPSPGFIDAHRPETLGAVCARAESVTVVKIDKFSAEKGVIVFRKVKDLKGELPRDEVRDLVGDGHEAHEKKHTLGSVKVGQTAVIFRYENRLAIGLGDHWHVIDIAPPKDRDEPWGGGTRTEPWFLQAYCGDADKLVEAVTDILADKEVVVPNMVGGRDKELRQRKGEMVRMRTSLKIKNYDLERDRVKDEPKK